MKPLALIAVRSVAITLIVISALSWWSAPVDQGFIYDEHVRLKCPGRWRDQV